MAGKIQDSFDTGSGKGKKELEEEGVENVKLQHLGRHPGGCRDMPTGTGCNFKKLYIFV